MKFAGIMFTAIQLKAKIYVKGANKAVELDHCSFALEKLPNTAMKLELQTGGYEKPEREAALRFIQPEWGIVELGACIGVVACVTNKLLKNPTNHVVLEINPLVLPLLKANRDANGCAFQVIDKALAYDVKTITFNPWLDFWGNSLYHSGDQPPVTVMTTTLTDILQEQRFDKFALICDIEGQEYEMIMREPDTVEKAELIIMEVHPHILGDDKVQRIISQLTELHFEIIARSVNVITLRKAA
ncbi:MAG TPA: FkbM family methyltransferase [Edaphobacter sp.]|jgi:FkbM family methyltransferase|nr:FkbM family methyltransferase [Edaphobacter sp.]